MKALASGERDPIGVVVMVNGVNVISAIDEFVRLQKTYDTNI